LWQAWWNSVEVVIMLMGVHFNELLNALSPGTRDAVLSRSKLVNLKPRQILHDRLSFVTHAYFVEEGAVSVQIRPSSESAGAGLMGRLGMTGVSLILGTFSSPFRALVLTQGRALQVEAGDFQWLMEQYPDFAALMYRYVQARMVTMAQMSFCNASHTVDQRIRRWLLVAEFVTRDRELCFTHEQIARLLGIRRPSATESIRQLENKGLIRQARKCITVLDSDGLAAGACDCHRQIYAEFGRVLSPVKPVRWGAASVTV